MGNTRDTGAYCGTQLTEEEITELIKEFQIKTIN
jgi:hypothetical protein